MKRRGIERAAHVMCLATLVLLLICRPAHAADDQDVPTAPKNGIPLVTIEIDESRAALAERSEADPDHTYGTVRDMNNSVDHSVRCVGTMKIQIPDGFKSEYASNEVPKDTIKFNHIRGRGKSTWVMGDKKPYRIRFDEPIDFFDMGANESWALIPNMADPTLLRNRLALKIGSLAGLDFTPQQVPVDVVMYGNKSGATYLGSYTLSETVRLGSGRIDIPLLDENETDDAAITGGYELSVYSEQDEAMPESTYLKTDSGIQMLCEYPEFASENLTEGERKQRAYIREYINRLDALIMDGGDINAERHESIAALMDMRSTADYWWIQEFSCNPDAYKTSSTYLYKDRVPQDGSESVAGGRLCWGPLWDFDQSFFMGVPTKRGNVGGFNNTQFPWLDRLRDKDPRFDGLLKQRWEDPRNGINKILEGVTAKGGALDRYYAEIESSWLDNAKLWLSERIFENAKLSPKEKLKEYIEEIRSWIDRRRAWINAHLDELGDVTYTMTYQIDGKKHLEIDARGNSYLAYPPVHPKREGQYFTGWKEVESGEDALGYRPNGDTTFEASYIDAESAVMPEAVYFPKYEVVEWLHYAKEEQNMLVTIPADTSLNTARWTTSNADVAVVTNQGIPRIVGVGSTTITATFPNGVSASYSLRVTEPDDFVEHELTGLLVPSLPMTMEVGTSAQIPVNLLPDRRNLVETIVDCESSNSSIVRVFDGNARVIEAMKPGRATLTVRAMNADHEVLREVSREVIVVEQGATEHQSANNRLNRLARMALIIGATLIVGLVVTVVVHSRRNRKS